MTSAEAGSLPANPELSEVSDPDGEGSAEETLWRSPWAPNEHHRRGSGAGRGPIPNVPPGNPLSQAAPNSPVAPGGIPAVGARAPASTSTVPGAASPGGTPSAGTAGTPAVAGPPPPVAAPVEDEQRQPENGGLPVDPELLSDMAPMALMAGTSLLPILGSALTGLLGGGAGGDGAAPEGQLSPEAQKALEALDLLAEVYGDGPTDDPEIRRLREELGLVDGSGGGETGGSSASSGETGRMVKARRLFQKNAATAFNNLDNQLANYIKRLAGTNSVDKKAVHSLIREVNVALAELGPQAYTKEGQQKVREILTRALRKAHGIVSGGQANANDTATAIDKLTNQYLYNIAGQQVPQGYMNMAGSVGAGGTPAARKAVEVALAQVGDPYVWGAEGPNSFDCSGLMQYAASAAGRNIPRVSQDQYRSLPKVAPSAIQPGDLIFPTSSFNGGTPGHVMMYIGNGQVVHAPSAGKNVEVKALPSSFHATRWA